MSTAGRAAGALRPIFLPADPAIPVGEVPVRPQVTRALQPDHRVLQRERRPDVPMWLWSAAGGVVFALTFGFLGALAWGVGRLARASTPPAPAPGRRSGRFRGPARTGPAAGAPTA